MTLAASKASVRSQEQDWKLPEIKKITWSPRKAIIDLVMFSISHYVSESLVLRGG